MTSRNFAAGIACLLLIDSLVQSLVDPSPWPTLLGVTLRNLGGVLAIGTALWLFTWILLPQNRASEPKVFLFLTTVLMMTLYWLGVLTGSS
jgi:hypothetical protein